LNPIVRPTGILIENGRILLIKQALVEQQHWTLPGGALEFDETIKQCLIREMKEETGLDVKVKEMLYVTDRFHKLKHHIVDISFLVERVGGELIANSFTKGDRETIREIKMVPVDEITIYGFSEKFCRLIKDNFPGRGSYKGDFHTFYGGSRYVGGVVK
jgi:ADP-ribose pyrophosphatase YjhB (NUDIX family)